MMGILKNFKGQVTIFFATTIIVMITMMAFIVNIGIFVKAKINLQNATDAAAYAGASVQARQLTNIAYLNWEMRNIYKEWMFKYYVLGGINLNGVINPSGSGPMDFTMQSYSTADSLVAKDNYNFPSICIDFAQTGGVGLCTKYMVPGLPRFPSDQVLGMSETTNAFVDSIVAQKNKDCSERTQINFYTATTWAYNVTDIESTSVNHLRDLAPEIAAGRMGAFPKAFEVALRIRNLEAQVNRAPQAAVCVATGANPLCSQGIEEIVGGEPSPSQERLYKAFYSGFRNLGSESDNELRRSFTLTEIAPQDVTFGDAFSTSTLLIPSGEDALTKRYLDLKLMTLNYATFYTAFTPGTGKYDFSGNEIASEGQCTATKMALPVPGYPLGYVKNPDVLTYYAVKGEAQFVGLFNPFKNIPINLTAFSAAKPFGGRIGPMLFSTSDSSTINPRQEGFRSSPYMSALDTFSFRNQYDQPLDIDNPYEPGVPLPINIDNINFWMTDASANVGGYAGSGANIFFGIPNLAYDYPGSDYASRSDYTSSNEAIQILRVGDPFMTAGLYNPQMFTKLKNNLRGVGGVVDIEGIEDGIKMVRSPTQLEAHNYLIPTPESVNASLATDSFGVIYSDPLKTMQNDAGVTYNYYAHDMYAPVFSETTDTIYKTAGSIRGVLESYLQAQEPAIVKYIEAMGVAAQEMYTENMSTITNQNLAILAAKAISDLDPGVLSSGNRGDVVGAKPSCNSIAGQFAYFYLDTLSGVTSTPACPTPLLELMIERWNGTGFTNTYQLEYSLPEDANLKKQLFSAYRPGEEHDASGSGIQVNALTNSRDVMIRNFYSAKFIQLSALIAGPSESYGLGLPIISEGRQDRNISEAQKSFKNPINPGSVNLDLTKIKH